MRPVIRAEGLVKRYKEVTALDGLDLEVAEGQVLGLLGPNGAGKTTAVRILTTLLVPDGGRAEVAGIDFADPNGVRSRIGLSGQYGRRRAPTGLRTGMVGRLYRLGRASRAGGAAERFDLSGRRPAGEDLPGRYAPPSRPGRGARRQARRALPMLTTGLDLRSRASMWESSGSAKAE